MRFSKIFYLFFFLALLFCLSCSSNNSDVFVQSEKIIQKVLAQAGPSVVCVITKNQSTGQTKLAGGVIVDSSHILTLENVVDNTDQLTLLLQDGRKIKDINVIKTFCDFETNISLIEVAEKSLKPAKLISPKEEIAPGTTGIALYNYQYAKGLSACTGIIGQSIIGGCDAYDSPLLTYSTDWETDFSGAPVFNSKGELIALTEGKMAEEKHIQLLIPISTYYRIRETLEKDNGIVRSWIGVKPQRYSYFDNLLSVDTLPQGVLVEEVTKESPAYQCGIKSGDLIFECDGKKISNSTELRKIVTGIPVGSTVKIGLWRKQEKINVEIKTAKLSSLNKGRKCPFREI
jgi:serine protease Do